MTTRPARKAGYRDGSRAGRTLAKARAYRDGARDGWTDETQNGKREKEAMDALKKAPPMPIGTAPGAGGGLNLTGADRDALSSGEVRRVGRYMEVMRRKAKLLGRMKDEAQVLVDTCKEMVTRVSKLQDAARAQEVGAKTLAGLALYEERVRAALQRAEQQQEQLLRATDRATEVESRARERYRGIITAVADSGKDAPSNMTYYKR